MQNITGALNSTVPISMFNRGQAGKVFDDVKKNGARIVMRNNAPECVLISPEEYIRMNDELNDAKLALLAMERLTEYRLEDTIPANEIYRELGITDTMIGGGEVELE